MCYHLHVCSAYSRGRRVLVFWHCNYLNATNGKLCTVKYSVLTDSVVVIWNDRLRRWILLYYKFMTVLQFYRVSRSCCVETKRTTSDWILSRKMGDSSTYDHRLRRFIGSCYWVPIYIYSVYISTSHIRLAIWPALDYAWRESVVLFARVCFVLMRNWRCIEVTCFVYSFERRNNTSRDD